MAFGAAFAGRNLAGVGANLADASLLVAAVFCARARLVGHHLHGRRVLRHRFTGLGLMWLNRASGAVILGFGVVALISCCLCRGGRSAARSGSSILGRCCPFCSTPRSSRTRW